MAVPSVGLVVTRVRKTPATVRKALTYGRVALPAVNTALMLFSGQMNSIAEPNYSLFVEVICDLP